MLHTITQRRRLAQLASLAAGIVAAVSAAGASPALAQTTAADPNAAAIAALQTYELPNQTASARLPAGWQVVATGIGFIQARGPNGELALFGVMLPAHNASSPGSPQQGLTMPYASDPEQMFLQSINWIRAHNGKSPVQAQFIREKTIAAPPAFGTCTNLIAVLNGVVAVESDFCALPMDSAGNYRVFFKAVGLPVGEARQERTLLEAILASYRLNMQAIKQHRMAAPPAQSGGNYSGGSVAATVSAGNSLMAQQLMMEEANAINQETINNERASDQSFEDFDHGVLRGETPIYADGDPEPVFWVGD